MREDLREDFYERHAPTSGRGDLRPLFVSCRSMLGEQQRVAAISGLTPLFFPSCASFSPVVLFFINTSSFGELAASFAANPCSLSSGSLAPGSNVVRVYIHIYSIYICTNSRGCGSGAGYDRYAIPFYIFLPSPEMFRTSMWGGLAVWSQTSPTYVDRLVETPRRDQRRGKTAE